MTKLLLMSLIQPLRLMNESHLIGDLIFASPILLKISHRTGELFSDYDLTIIL
jgi:hypothetical protein